MPRGLKFFLSSLLIGAMSIGAAWAGAILMPPASDGGKALPAGADNWLAQVDTQGDTAQLTTAGLEALQANQVYAGAHKVNIAPRPADYNGTWETDQAHCETFGAPHETEPTHVPDFRVRWNENNNCIYAGGYDLGPANAISRFDEQYGLWARATAISDGTDTVVLMLLDGAYYFAKYAQMCNDRPAHASKYDGTSPGANAYTQDCGFRDLQASMAAKYGYTGATRGTHGIEPGSFFLASSHAHASPDFVGAWGGVPRWYMQQVEDAIREAVYGAIDTMQPTYLEAGEILYRGGNQSRRRHYHAAEEASEAWMRFVAEEDAEPVCTTPEPTPQPTPTEHVPPGQAKKQTPSPTPTPEPVCTQPPPTKRAVATIGTYAAHPVDSSGGRAYADISGVFAKAAEDRFGGLGIFFQTGFGNITARGGRGALAQRLVSFLPDLGQGPQITGGLDVKSVMRTFDQPATNAALSMAGVSGVFDRPFEPRPSAVSIGKGSLSPEGTLQESIEEAWAEQDPEKLADNRSPHKRCNSASALTVNSSVSVAKIGSLLITGGPGELFSNYTNTIKEQYQGGIAFPLSLVNDGLGYIMQSIETDHVGRQAVGFVNGPVSEYEDAYSIDACFGDHALEQTLAGMNAL
jgi:hypothetical protein